MTANLVNIKSVVEPGRVRMGVLRVTWKTITDFAGTTSIPGVNNAAKVN